MISPASLPEPDHDRLRAFQEELERRYEAEHGGVHYWQGHRQWWLDDMGTGHEARILRFLQRFDPLIDWRGKRCLDMGCGTGGALVALQALGAEAIGIDPEMVGRDLDFARLRASLYGMDVTMSLGDGTRLDYDDGSFDVVFSSSVAEHVADIGAYFAEAWRVLEPGGWFLLSTDNRAALREGHTGLVMAHWLPYKAFRALANRRMGKPADAPLEVYPRSYRFYRRLGVRTGFRAKAGRLDSILAATAAESSASKRRVAEILKASRLPVEWVLPGTLIVFRKHGAEDAV